ncbi:Trk system potassium transporter TrkA [Myxococcota bacterium]|nr:Trk system potassium transporter TrkA [Myxococcota bacterium]MBU1534526.1 Trk system potassium transporter TrkA [Myxococcota bacterium]
MDIIIVGAGEVGSALAGKLSREGHDVTVVESGREKLELLQERFDVQGVLGSGTEPEILLAAGIARVDACVAVTDSDSTNIVVCMMAKAYGKPEIRKMARLRSDTLLSELDITLKTHLPVDWVVHPEVLAVRRIVDKVRYPQLDEIIRFVSGKVAVAGLTLKKGHPVVGKTIEELRKARQLPFLIGLVIRKGEISIPRGTMLLAEGDLIYIIAPVQKLGQILKAFTAEGSTYRQVMIAGGTVLAEKIGQKLAREGIRVKMLVSGKKAALALAERNESILVIDSEPTDLATLTEEAGESLDLFVAATGQDEVNVVASMLAQQAGVPHTVTVVRKRKLAQRLAGLPLGMIVSPRSVAVEHILHMLRENSRFELDSFSPLEGTKVREFTIQETSPMVNRLVRELSFPVQTLVGALVRGNRVVIPDGDTKLQVGDRALCFALSSSLEPLEGFWEQSGDKVIRR